MKNQLEIFKALLDGKTVRNIVSKTEISIDNGSLVNQDGVGAIYYFDAPEDWSILEPKKKYEMKRHWFINHLDRLHYYDTHLSSMHNLIIATCTCCNYKQKVKKTLEVEALKAIEA